MMRKTFSTLAVASAATGFALTDELSYSLMAEIGSFALGYSLWTHELGDKVTTGRIRRAIFGQLPNLPNLDDARVDWKKAATKALAEYGDTVELTEGSETRSEGPVESLVRMTGSPDNVVVVKL